MENRQELIDKIESLNTSINEENYREVSKKIKCLLLTLYYTNN